MTEKKETPKTAKPAAKKAAAPKAKAKPKKAKYLTSDKLTQEDRKKLIEHFNKAFGAQMPLEVNDPRTLRAMQRRIASG